VVVEITLARQARDAEEAESVRQESVEGARAHDDLASSAFHQASELDKSGRSDDALPLYLQAAEQYLEASRVDPTNPLYRKKAELVISHVEAIKRAIESERVDDLDDTPAPQTSQPTPAGLAALFRAISSRHTRPDRPGARRHAAESPGRRCAVEPLHEASGRRESRAASPGSRRALHQ
jgi:hypothetical protein